MESAELLQLIGLKSSLLCELDCGMLVHGNVVADWQRLAAKAQEVGLNLTPVSGYRSFDRQLAIWNGKANGERAVLDANSVPVDIRSLSDDELLSTLLIWSALPGCSRHHWGSELDIAAQLPADYRLQLVPEEYAAGGVLAELGEWLNSGVLAECGFARPFLPGRSKVAYEPWHISHVATAQLFEQQLDAEAMLELLLTQPIALKDAIIRNWSAIFADYIAAPCLRGQLCP